MKRIFYFLPWSSRRFVMPRAKHQPASMNVIVIHQPWIWLIVNGYKGIENRTWATR
jgi:hypothetical protein